MVLCIKYTDNHTDMGINNNYNNKKHTIFSHGIIIEYYL